MKMNNLLKQNLSNLKLISFLSLACNVHTTTTLKKWWKWKRNVFIEFVFIWFSACIHSPFNFGYNVADTSTLILLIWQQIYERERERYGSGKSIESRCLYNVFRQFNCVFLVLCVCVCIKTRQISRHMENNYAHEKCVLINVYNFIISFEHFHDVIWFDFDLNVMWRNHSSNRKSNSSLKYICQASFLNIHAPRTALNIEELFVQKNRFFFSIFAIYRS